MQSRVKIVFAGLLAIFLGVMAWQRLCLHEPVYRGKPLSQCLAPSLSDAERGIRNWEARQLEADNAVRQAGTNALPTLLRMLRAKDSPLKLGFIPLAQRQHIIATRYASAEEQNDAAQRAFMVLGAQAQSAVPALLEIANRNISPASRYAAIDALGNIGPRASEAVPSLLRWATNGEGPQACHAITALGRVGAEPHRVLPVLTNALSDPNVRPCAASALGEFGTNASLAVPALVRLLDSDMDLTDKSVYSNALKQIDPRAY